QPGALGFLCIHHAAREDQIHRLGLAHRASQPLGASHARDDAQADFWLAELGLFAGQQDGADHRNLATAAEREAVDGRDDWGGDLRDALPLEEHLLLADFGVGLGLHLLDISARGEGLIAASDQNRADIRVLIEALYRIYDGVHELAVEGVERLRTVEPDRSDAVIGAGKDDV